jgi:acetylornithine/succinyldiaminopimelate/putrescine aminotransferase
LDVLRRFGLVERSAVLGERFVDTLRAALGGLDVEVRGSGLMVAIDLGERAGSASRVMAELLRQGYLVSTGGTSRDVVVLTPPLLIEEELLLGSVAPLRSAIEKVCGDP